VLKPAPSPSDPEETEPATSFTHFGEQEREWAGNLVEA
jgi:hypothetical protein